MRPRQIADRSNQMETNTGIAGAVYIGESIRKSAAQSFVDIIHIGRQRKVHRKVSRYSTAGAVIPMVLGEEHHTA